MKKALILQHEESTPLLSTLEWLNKNHYQNQICRVDLNQVIPEVEPFDLIIICGGMPNVDQENIYPWMTKEKAFISEAISEKKKLVGLCLGSQLLAERLGAKVARHHHDEIGWWDVQLIPDGKIVNNNDAKEVKVFQWHSYTWQLPPKAQLIGTNEACKTQAFIYEDFVMAFQFHPESTRDWVIEAANDPILPPGKFCQFKEEMLSDTDKYLPLLKRWYHQCLDRFTSGAPPTEANIHKPSNCK